MLLNNHLILLLQVMDILGGFGKNGTLKNLAVSIAVLGPKQFIPKVHSPC